MSSSIVFYKGEFKLDVKGLRESIDFSSIKDKIINNIKVSNKKDKDTYIIITKINKDGISFFIRTELNTCLTSERFMDYFKWEKFMPLFFKGELDNMSIDLFEGYINKALSVQEVEAEDCFDYLKELVDSGTPMFTRDDFNLFFKGVNINAQNDEIEAEYTGIFDETFENEEGFNYERILQNLNYLVGVKEFKEEMFAIARYAELNRKLQKTSQKRVFPLHYIFTIEPGMGLTTILKTFTENLYKLGIITSNEFIEYGGSIPFDGKIDDKSGTWVFVKGEGGKIKVDEDYGVIALNIGDLMGDPAFNFNKLMDILKHERGKVVFVLVIQGKSKEETLRLIEMIKGKVNCHHIHFPEYTHEQLVEIGKKLLKKYGFALDEQAEQYLLQRLDHEMQNGSFHNIRTLQKIIEEVRVEKSFNFKGTKDSLKAATLYPEDFAVVSDVEMDSSDVWKELDDLVGLNNVKQKIKEIAAYAKMQKKLNDLGIQDDDNCYHMMFTGNPGTGKTTVARIVGRIFKEIGILKIGDTIEVGRDGLVGRYVGHTAPKVREKVKEAIGSVLFIDEAYSLYSGAGRIDYGYEALDTLIKEMENRRNELIVILAGYTDEMQKLLEMNPGLKERVPYMVDFPDYNAEQLTDILIKILGKDYRLADGVYQKIFELFEAACKNAGKSFANGRLARNIAERLKIKHSVRICNENSFERDAMLTITLEDMQVLYDDDDVQKSIKNPEHKLRRIGF